MNVDLQLIQAGGPEKKSKKKPIKALNAISRSSSTRFSSASSMLECNLSHDLSNWSLVKNYLFLAIPTVL